MANNSISLSVMSVTRAVKNYIYIFIYIASSRQAKTYMINNIIITIIIIIYRQSEFDLIVGRRTPPLVFSQCPQSTEMWELEIERCWATPPISELKRLIKNLVLQFSEYIWHIYDLYFSFMILFVKRVRCAYVRVCVRDCSWGLRGISAVLCSLCNFRIEKHASHTHTNEPLLTQRKFAGFPRRVQSNSCNSHSITAAMERTMKLCREICSVPRP